MFVGCSDEYRGGLVVKEGRGFSIGDMTEDCLIIMDRKCKYIYLSVSCIKYIRKNMICKKHSK